MEYRFSKKMNSLKPSAIREILKSTADPEIISFAAGNPSVQAFPVDKIREISKEILESDPVAALQYGVTEGYPPLLRLIKKRLSVKLNTDYTDDETIVVSGAQQALDLAGKVLLNEGDAMLCENPSFIGALNSFKANGASLAGIELENDGVNLEKLENAIKQNKNVKAFYVIPNFQNPSGITTSLEKRKAIYDICSQNSVIVLEDDPYGELRFHGEDIPAIKSFDNKGAVIYCGSFSKVLAPGIRVGHVTANREIINRMVVAKQSADVHTNMWAQLVCYKFMTECDFDAHLANLRKIYKDKCNLMISEIDKNFSRDFIHTNPEGGLFIWCTAPARADIMEFCRRAVEKKVAVVPGSAFLPYADKESTTSFRLNFSTPTDDEIIKGIRLLGEVTNSI